MKPERKPTLAEASELWLAQLLRHLPVAWTSAIGGYFGALQGRKAIAAERKWVKRLHGNIERFSEVADTAERERRIIEYARRIGRMYAEFTVLQRIPEEGRLEVVGAEHLRDLSRPVILASAHLSNWELVFHAFRQLEGVTCVLYDPPKNPVRHRLAVKARSGWHPEPELVPASSRAMRQLTKAIEQGRNLLMYVDEEKDGYIWAPALGRRLPYAGNRWLTARLAVRYNADILPIHIEAAGNARYRMIVQPKLIAGEGDAETRARSLADQMEHHLDAWIRARPEEWYWLNLLDLAKRLPGTLP